MKSLKGNLKTHLSSKEKISLFWATGALVGYIPPLPGTLGAIEGILLYRLTINFPFFYQIIFLLFISLLGIHTAKVASEIMQKEDPDEVIIDEICGAYLACLGKKTFFEFFLVFIIFRIIDIGKPYPLKRIERAPSGWGIMLDDLVAGLLTNLFVSLITFSLSVMR
ncbi:MAG: phosphatidylglycerophosphatase A family protein [Caldimicrobium sp.]|jgi:phosphatidylglycerophosphatase A